VITYEEVRHFLAAETTISSNLCMLLDRCREGRTTGSGDVRYAQAKDERQRLREARVIRCIDGLRAVSKIRYGRTNFPIKDIRRLAEACHWPDGEAVFRVLRAYEPWSCQWPEKGLAAVYIYVVSQNNQLKALAKVTAGLKGDDLAQAFRTGKCAGARQYASALVADAHVVLGEWVRIFDKREQGNVRQAS